MANEQVVVATIQAVEHNMQTGWFNIKTDKGRFDTKIQEKADEALALRGQEVQLWFTEGRASGNINPHTNRPYPPNNYYERAQRVGAAAANGGGFDVPSGPGENPERSWRICLQTGGKLAVQTLPLMPNEQRSFDTQKQIALAWAKFFFFTPAPHLIAGTQVTPPTPQEAYENEPAAVGGGYDTPSPPTDDIPY